MSYTFLAQLRDMLYQLHVVWSRPPSRFACSCGCKRGLRRSLLRLVDARYALSRCVIDLELLWWSAADTSSAVICAERLGRQDC